MRTQGLRWHWRFFQKSILAPGSKSGKSPHAKKELLVPEVCLALRMRPQKPRRPIWSSRIWSCLGNCPAMLGQLKSRLDGLTRFTVKSLLPEWLQMSGRSFALTGPSAAMFEAEQLEGRRLLSCSFSGGVHSMTATSSADAITIYQGKVNNVDSITIDRGNGIERCIQPISGITKVEVIAGNGADTVDVGVTGSLQGGTQVVSKPVSVNGGNGNDTIHGGEQNDTINGNEDDDQLFGGAGADLMYGNYGGDSLNGENGADTLYGDDDATTAYGGYDELNGGNDNDLMYGGYVDDTLDGGSGNDILYGGDGIDRLKDHDNSSADSLYGEAGNDVFETDNFDTINDLLDGGSGTDTNSGYSGYDTYISIESFS